MNAARLRWIALMAAFAVLTNVAAHRTRTAREYATSAQLYWHADQAILSVTTAAEVRNEGVATTAIRKLRELARLAPATPELRVGAAHVYSFRNGEWQSYQLNPAQSPKAFPLWPYAGKLYTWDDRQQVREVDNGMLIPVPASRATEVRQAFPNDPNNYVAADAAHPYAMMQDAITRDEWHAYQNLATLPNGQTLSFPVAGKMLEVVAERASGTGNLSVAIRDGDRFVPLWRAQAVPRSISRMELLRYMGARPLSPSSPNDRQRHAWIDLVGSLLVLFLLWAVFLRPLLLTGVPASIQFVDASEDEFPKLDRILWSDYSARLEALGFVHIRDVKIANMLTGGISRVFLHPDSNCYASVFQAFAPGAPGLLFGYISYLGEDWTVGHGINRPTPGNAINRLPHKLAFSRPGSALEELYHEHIRTRDQIAAGLGLPVVEPHGFETYQQRSDLDSEARRSVINRNPLPLAFKVYWAKIQPLSNDWWGDYPKEVQAITGQKFVPSEV